MPCVTGKSGSCSTVCLRNDGRQVSALHSISKGLTNRIHGSVPERYEWSGDSSLAPCGA
jgi:hypothetical protein